jgi:hypothetical protein
MTENGREGFMKAKERKQLILKKLQQDIINKIDKEINQTTAKNEFHVKYVLQAGEQNPKIINFITK